MDWESAVYRDCGNQSLFICKKIFVEDKRICCTEGNWFVANLIFRFFLSEGIDEFFS